MRDFPLFKVSYFLTFNAGGAPAEGSTSVSPAQPRWPGGAATAPRVAVLGPILTVAASLSPRGINNNNNIIMILILKRFSMLNMLSCAVQCQ